MTPRCPKCQRTIPAADVNVANDVAFCRVCNAAHPLSELVHEPEIDPNVDLTRPPAGAWYRSTGLGSNIGATHRSFGAAIGLLAVTLFWNGIVSVFVVLAIGSTLHLLQWPIPSWFPSSQMKGGEFAGWGMTIFLWLFLTPFIVIGTVMFVAFLSALGGRTEVRIHHTQGEVFTGIGPLGWRRRFNAEGVKAVRIENQTWRDKHGRDQNKTHLVIEPLTGKRIKFGSMLRDDRRDFVVAAVRKALAQGGSEMFTP